MNRNSRRRGASYGFALMIALSLAAANACASTSREYDFTVYLDERPIGTHRFAVADDGHRRSVDITADFRVRVLFLTVYAYRHENRELWDGDCLQQIRSRTDDNGDLYRVDGERLTREFVLNTPVGETVLPSCVRSFSYWDPRILEAERLLNAQSGEYVDITVEALGPEMIPVRGHTVPADRYRLTAGDIAIDLWYSPRREWLALESTTASGARLRYRME